MGFVSPPGDVTRHLCSLRPSQQREGGMEGSEGTARAASMNLEVCPMELIHTLAKDTCFQQKVW